LQRLASRNAWKIVTDSNASKTELIESLQVSPEKIIVIYLGGSNDTLREDISINNYSYFLAGGNRFKHKNWEGLLQAFNLLDSAVRPKLIITGGRPPDPLIEIIKKYNLQDYIESVKWIPEFEKEKLYLRARAVIVPSFVEGFSLPVVQAMQDGVPLIISDIPVHREIAEDAAYYFNPESPKSIADAIIEIMNNPNKTYERAKLGLARGCNFTWEKCAKSMLILINEALLLNKK
jgi:glycosyltransferase involved in cell wall biosynthesis